MEEDTTGQGLATNDDPRLSKSEQFRKAIGQIGGAAEILKDIAAAPAPEHTPTRQEAREMFKANPGLWAVLTTEGNMTRDEC